MKLNFFVLSTPTGVSVLEHSSLPLHTIHINAITTKQRMVILSFRTEHTYQVTHCKKKIMHKKHENMKANFKKLVYSLNENTVQQDQLQ